MFLSLFLSAVAAATFSKSRRFEERASKTPGVGHYNLQPSFKTNGGRFAKPVKDDPRKYDREFYTFVHGVEPSGYEERKNRRLEPKDIIKKTLRLNTELEGDYLKNAHCLADKHLAMAKPFVSFQKEKPFAQKSTTYPKVHISAQPWSALKVFKIFSAVAGKFCALNDIKGFQTPDMMENGLKEALQSFTTQNETVGKKNYEVKKWEKYIPYAFKLTGNLPRMRWLWLQTNENYSKGHPYSTQTGKFITLYTQDAFRGEESGESMGIKTYKAKSDKDAIDEYSKILKDLDSAFHHAKKIGYLNNQDFVPLLGDMQIGTSGFLYMRNETTECDDRNYPIQNTDAPCFVKDMPIFWRGKRFHLDNKTEQPKEWRNFCTFVDQRRKKVEKKIDWNGSFFKELELVELVKVK